MENSDKKQFETEELGLVQTTKGKHPIHCLTIIGQIEGHFEANNQMKTTKYEHVIPQLVDVQENPGIYFKLPFIYNYKIYTYNKIYSHDFIILHLNPYFNTLTQKRKHLTLFELSAKLVRVTGEVASASGGRYSEQNEAPRSTSAPRPK